MIIVMGCWMILVLFGLLAGLSLSDAGPTSPYNLQCQRNFVGLSKSQLRTIATRHHFVTDDPNPLLSWSIAHTEREAYQKAFRVQVSKDFSFNNVVWDSGTVPNEQQEIIYHGPDLENSQLYFWNVTWWDHNGNTASSEEIGHFMAVVDFSWNNVSWIYSSISHYVSNAHTFGKTIDLRGKKIDKAVLYISGLGFYRAYVNGHDLHQMADPPLFFVPGWTNYAVRIGYQVFDVTEYVKENLLTTLKVALGVSYRNTSVFHVHDDKVFPAPDTVERVLRAVFEINFIDGSEPMVINTDETWDVYTSRYLYTSIYNGEYYDSLVTESPVAKADITPGPSGVMYIPNNPNIVETGYDLPINIYSSVENFTTVQIVDFGVNTAGVVNISVAGLPAGHMIQMKHTEVPLHRPYGNQNGSMYYDNLRGALQLDTYISNGVDKFYKPVFTYHGFRYLIVHNYPRALTKNDLIRVRVSTNLKANSKFNTSIPLLNRLNQNVIVSHTSNMMTVPTDCNQRDERLGWMGDTGLSADAMALNFHMESYFPHRVMIIDDDVFNGSVPEVTPYYRFGDRPAGPSWAEAYIQLPWVLMKYYGEVETGHRFHKGIMDYIVFTEEQTNGNFINIDGRNGDWCQPEECPKIDNHFTAAFSFLMMLQGVVEMFEQFDDLDGELLEKVHQMQTDQFNMAYMTADNEEYKSDLEISYGLPMYLGIIPTASYGEMYNLDHIRLINKMAYTTNCSVDLHFTLTSGIVGTKAILPDMSKIKQNDIAIETVRSVDYPSYGFMIHNPYEPATSVWELWNSHNGSASMDSRNHHMFSSVGGWLQTGMIGFQQIKGTYGYKELDLYPASSFALSSASIELDYPKPIKYSYYRKGGVQCGKAAEESSKRNPNLPNFGGLVLECGEGVVTKVLFASYGNPLGICGGYFRYGGCHATNSTRVVEELCMNKSSCHIPTSGDFWGDFCPGQLEVRWLTVEVQCSPSYKRHTTSPFTTLNIDVSIPIRSTAHVHIPTHGLDELNVWDGETLVYSKDILTPTKGIMSADWNNNLLRFNISSGDYSFTVKGQVPNDTQTLSFNGTVYKLAQLHCTNSINVISSIDWASYGNPSMVRGIPSIGKYHSYASKMIIEDLCIGAKMCSIPMDKNVFFSGSPYQYQFGSSWNLIVKFSCTSRNL